MKIIGIGDNVADCYIHEKKYYPGGNAVNVAVGCKRNGADTAAYLGIFGNDNEAAHIRQALIKEGIDISRCRKVHLPSGHPWVALNKDGDRVFLKSNRNNCQHMVKLNFIEDDLDYIASYDLIHTSCFSHIDNELHLLKQCSRLSYDFSNRATPEYLKAIGANLKYAFISASHLSSLEREKLMETGRTCGIEVIGLTLGEEGAIFSIKGEIHMQKVKKVNTIDTMGAGDSFISGFLVKYEQGVSPAAALAFAAEAAAKTCLEKGAFGYGKDFEKDYIVEDCDQ